MSAVMMKDLVQPFGEYPASMFRDAAGFAARLRAQWERAIHDAALTRRLPELHKTRDEYRLMLEGHLRLREELRTVAAIHHHAMDLEGEPDGELDAALDGLRKFHDELFPRWDTYEDFCQMALEVVRIPASRLDEIARKHPPPQSWYDETINPFEEE